MKKRIIFKTIFCFLGIALSACEEFLTEEPEGQVSYSNYWKTEQDVENAVYGMHSYLRYAMTGSEVLYRDRGLPFDEFSSVWIDIENNELEKRLSRDDASLSWYNCYKVIACANMIIENIRRADLQEERYNFYLGQAYTVRAWVYFNICQTWGDAPLILESEDVGEKARIPWPEILDVVIGDLKEAVRLLPTADKLADSEGKAIQSKQTPSKGMAWAILAHVYAWKASLNKEPELYVQALNAANEVINSGVYSLVSDPEEVCTTVLLGNSREGIFEIECRNTESDLLLSGRINQICQTWPLERLATPAKKRNLRINNSTVMALYSDPRDKRRDSYFYKLDSMANVSTSITQGAAYIYKWRHIIFYESGFLTGYSKGYEDNIILIRLGGLMLLRAEIKARLGDIQGAVADVNLVRRRAGARDYSPAEGDLLKFIYQERVRELFLEGISIRYFDIVRNGFYREELRGKFRTLTDEDVANGALFLPVRSSAFLNNTLMRQTTYWLQNGFDN